MLLHSIKISVFALYSYNHLELRVIKSDPTCVVCKRIFKERGEREKKKREKRTKRIRRRKWKRTI